MHWLVSMTSLLVAITGTWFNCSVFNVKLYDEKRSFFSVVCDSHEQVEDEGVFQELGV